MCSILAGILLYLLDVAFRMAQQAQPVVVSNVSVCKSATLATLHFNADPHTPIKPIQVPLRRVCCSQRLSHKSDMPYPEQHSESGSRTVNAS